MINVYLVRHGETYFNLYHKIQGRVDSPLTPLGIKQAKATGEYFHQSNVHFDYAFSSSSERATDTLELITAHQLPFKRNKNLKEMAFGSFEAHDETLNPKPPYGDFFKQFGGESETEVQERMDKAIRSCLQDIPDGKNVLIVSHAGAIINFLVKELSASVLLHVKHFANCGVVILTYDGKNFALKKVVNPAEKVIC